MKKILLFVSLAILSLSLKSQIVTDIEAAYRNGQTFITWEVIPNYLHPYYYVYRYDYPITSDNIDYAKYMGKIPYNFSHNYFLTLGIDGPNQPPHYYMVINNNPTEQLDSSHGLFVATCNKEKTFYYAVTADSTVAGPPVENRRIVQGVNATTLGVQEQVEPITAYLQVSGIPLQDNPNLFYEGYVVFGGNVKTEYTPLMGNEGCFAFNYGLIRDNDFSTPTNAATFFFYGGGGNAYDNANGTTVPGMWKVSMEDDLPNFNWDPVGGENTKWIGYNENFDVYGAGPTSDEPTSGVDRVYAVWRVKWTLDWLLRTFPEDIDSTRIYLVGSSNGCTGALTLMYLYPEKIAAVDVTNAKLNLEYIQDDNPQCRWNTQPKGTSRSRAEIFLGTQLLNLPSDVPKINGPGYYTLYDFGNFNILNSDNKYKDMPVMFLTSGKADYVTCWQEKLPFYKNNQANRTGTFFYWDLREHKGGTHTIKDRPLELLFRYRNDLSYPAFSNGSYNSDPGGLQVDSPWHNGDTVGTINGMLDWMDTSIHDTDTSWQAIVFSHQFELTTGEMYPATLPLYVKVDITPRRLQKFKNIPEGTIICMENWEGNILKQSRSVTYHPNDDGLGLITFRKAKVSQGGNLIKFYICGTERLPSTDPMIIETRATDNVYPNPTSGITYIDFSLLNDEKVTIMVRDIFGKEMLLENMGVMNEGEYEIPVDFTALSEGVYFVTVSAGNTRYGYKVVKQD